MRLVFVWCLLSCLLLAFPGCFDCQEKETADRGLFLRDVALEKGLLDLDKKVLLIDYKSLRVIIRNAWESTDVREFKDLNEFVVVDVRGFDEYLVKRIRGSVNVELKDLKHESARWEKTRKVIVYSNNENCPVVSKAARRLVSYGFKKVFVYDGGLDEWTKNGFEVDGIDSLV